MGEQPDRQHLRTSEALLCPTPASAVMVTVSFHLSLESGILFLHLYFRTITIFLFLRDRSATTLGDKRLDIHFSFFYYLLLFSFCFSSFNVLLMFFFIRV